MGHLTHLHEISLHRSMKFRYFVFKSRYSKAIPNNLNFISTFTTVEICLMVIYLSYTISKASAKFQHFVVLHWWISGGSDCHFACLVFLQASKDR